MNSVENFHKKFDNSQNKKMFLESFVLRILHIIICLIYVPLFPCHTPKVSGVVPRSTNFSPFQPNENPIWVAQLSDLHVSPIYNVSTPRVNETLRYIAKNVNAHFTIMTGDLTDNLDTSNVYSGAYPHEEHYKLFQKIERESGIPQDRIVEILGNHDTWTRTSFSHYYQYFIHGDKMKKNFYVQSYTRDGVRVIAFSPIHFPTGHTTYHFIVPIYTEELDALEEALEEPTDAKITIVASHFPTIMILPHTFVYSTKTHRNLKQLLNDPKYNVIAFLNGHTHPPSFAWHHFGSVVEITSTALLAQDGFGILSHDNGYINYRTHTQHEEKLAILTYPGSDSLASYTSNRNDFQIRVVAITPNAKNFEVSGAVNGKLKFDRELEGGSSLYSLDVHLPNGRHKITISGDLNDTCEFSIGKPYPFTEIRFTDLNPQYTFIWMGIFTVFYVCVFIAEFTPISSHFIDEASLWLTGEAKSPINSLLDVLKAIIIIPFIIGKVVKRFPALPKYSLLLITFASYLCPIAFDIIEGKIAFWDIYGIYVKGMRSYDACSFMFIHWTVAYNLFAFYLFFIHLYYKGKKSFIQKFIDYFIDGVVLGLGIYFWTTYGDNVIAPLIYRISIHFHWMPLIMTIIFVISALSSQKDKNKVKEN